MALPLFAAGCFSMQKAETGALVHSDFACENGTPLEHVVVSNYGWYLFDVLPIVCGDPDAAADDLFAWKLFSNRVNADDVHDRFMRYASERGMTAGDVSFYFTDSCFLDLPIAGASIPVPYLVCYREVQISGVLARPAAVPDGENTEKDGRP